MYEPETLVWKCGRLLEIWHNEHSDKRSLTVPFVKTLLFRLFARCAECERRFGWRETPYGYISSDQHWHLPCMNLRRLHYKCDDLVHYIDGTADKDAKFRVEKMYLGTTEVGL